MTIIFFLTFLLKCMWARSAISVIVPVTIMVDTYLMSKESSPWVKLLIAPIELIQV